ncbi:MAG: hypothetical protein IT429_22515 [Gemmataceae bacterium]|nr:hypothetical protein [Gemmataceae bacterium]
MLQVVCKRPRAFLWLALLTFAGGVGAALAQDQQLASREDLEKKYRAHRERFEKLLRGEEAPTAEDEAVATAAAQWFAYSMTVPTLQSEPRKLYDLANQLQNVVNTAAANKGSAAFVKLFTGRLLAALKDVFALDPVKNRVACVNAAVLLPIYAKAKQQEFGDYLEALLRDGKKHDVVRLYAAKAMREYLDGLVPAKLSDDPNAPGYKQTIEKRARDASRVEAVIGYINHDWKLPKEPPKELLEAVHFIRREAIQTLAQAQLPALKALKGEIQTPIAYHLLRVLSSGKDALNPPASLSEKAEAAIGVCRLKAREVEDYLPEVGAYLVGQFLVEFTTKYIEDYPNFSVKEKEIRKPPLVSWKAYANRLLPLLDDLQKNLPAAHPLRAKLNDLLQKGRLVLGDIRLHNRVDSPALIQAATESLRPQSGTLYKDVKEFQIDLPAPGGV